MFRIRPKLQEVSVHIGHGEAVLNDDPSCDHGGRDFTDVSSALRNYGRMRQVIMFLIACVVLYLIGHVMHDVVLAKAGNLFLKLPDNASTLGMI